MSLDGSYNMVLLPPRRDDNDGLRLARRRRALRQHLPAAEEEHSGRPRHPPRRRRRRRGNHAHAGGSTLSAVTPERVDDAGIPPWDMSDIALAPEATAGVTSPRRVSRKRTDDASTLAKDLLGVTLVPRMTVCTAPNATSPPSNNQEVLLVFHPIPFRFSFDPPSDPAMVSAFVKAYPNLPGYHMWSTWDRLTAVSTFGPAGSEEEDIPDSGWDFSALSDPGAMWSFMSACDHCLSGCSDDGRDLDDEGYGLSRECFHVDLGDHNKGNHFGMPEVDDPPGPSSLVDILRELAVVPVPTGGGGVRTYSSSKSTRCRPGSMGKQANLYSSDRTSNRSGQADHSPEKPVTGPKTSGTASSTMPGQRCLRPSAGPARTLLQRRCCFRPCRSHPPPRDGASRANSRIF
jgi:hypothetical protein